MSVEGETLAGFQERRTQVKADQQLADKLVDAVAQCIWIRLRVYLRLGRGDETWLCDYGDLPEMSRAPLRLTAMEMIAAFDNDVSKETTE